MFQEKAQVQHLSVEVKSKCLGGGGGGGGREGSLLVGSVYICNCT